MGERSAGVGWSLRRAQTFLRTLGHQGYISLAKAEQERELSA